MFILRRKLDSFFYYFVGSVRSCVRDRGGYVDYVFFLEGIGVFLFFKFWGFFRCDLVIRFLEVCVLYIELFIC